GTGRHSVHVTAQVKAVSINGNGGSDVVRIGKFGIAQAVLGNVTVANSGGFTTLEVDDSGDPVARTNVILASISGGGTITNLAPGQITFLAGTANGVNALTLRGGGGDDTFTVADTAANTQIFSGSGPVRDTVNIQRTTAPLKVDSQFTGDEVVVGLNDSMEFIKGPVEIRSSGGASFARLKDTADTTTDNVTISTSGSTTEVTGLAEASIRFFGGEFVVNGGSGGNTYTVNGSFGNSLINAGSGNDTINVLGTLSDLRINGNGGQDKVTVGLNGSVQQIAGKLSIDGAANSIALTIDDSADPAARTARIE